ncbi:hypothetical protein B0T19DRAFT_429931 [Cercophora scortea]|uniref:Zn(2)-C6 fungal-type domain-containing protein n=1 Tax=Cercophora scortea TaxID=314031 RepID=A0AAE0I9J6_9PEZI|nr:hypothetical protein B0T19DRAFT_429931 [Cercophora scortea]
MDQTSPQPAAVQQYGKACINCSKSKCRCITRPNEEGCVRCHRLNKPCLRGASVRRSEAQKNNPIDRIAQLEGKLDGLIHTLSAGRITSPVGASPPGTAGTVVVAQAGHPGQPLSPQWPSGAPTAASDGHGAMDGFSPVAVLPAGPPLPHGHYPAAASQFHATQVADLPLSDLPADVEDCLRTFCSSMLRYFPFMHLTADLSWVRKERPFLLVCIYAAASKSTQTRLALCRRIKQTLADRLILSSHSPANLDLLLGLLTFLAWSQDVLFEETPHSLSRFTQLAMMIVFELRLNKQPAHEPNMLPLDAHGVSDSGTTSRRTEHTLEERRAVLGCFYMSAIISFYLGQIDALQWTPYMDESLDLLSRGTECPTDESFAHQVRLQLLSREVETARSLTMPSYFYFKAVQAKLDGIKAAISPHLQDDTILRNAIYFTQLSILEPGLAPDTPTPQRIECLYGCLQAVKAATENFFKLPPAEYPALLPFTQFVHTARYIKVLVLLSTLQDSMWDTALVRQTVDVLDFVDQVIVGIQLVTDSDMRSVDGVLARVARVFTAVRAWCAFKLSESSSAAAGGASGDGPGDASSGRANGGGGGAGPLYVESPFLGDLWTRTMFDGAASFEGLDFNF